MFSQKKEIVSEKKIEELSEELENNQKSKKAEDKNQKLKKKDEIQSQKESIKELFEVVINPEERTLKNYTSYSFWKEKSVKYKKLREKEKEDLNVYGILSDGARPSIEYYVLTVLSCIIATIGLIQGSTAVIIGAMIIAPLMTPILAFSLGVIQGDFSLMKTSVVSIGKGVFWALLISSAIAYIIPLPEYSNEIISRTHPSLFDILVALASGTVGAYGYANKKISNTLVGIAIAVALMPPLCTIGIGLGTFNLGMATGASVLFLINLVSISLAGAVIFWTMKIHPIVVDQSEIKKRAIGQILVSIIVLTGIAVPVGIFMREGYQLTEAKQAAVDVLKQELHDVSIFNMESEKTKNGIQVNIILTSPVTPEYKKLEDIRTQFLKKYTIISDIKVRFIQTKSIVEILKE